MKLIIGLGNPGIKYKNNRHNVGHMFIDYLLRSPRFARDDSNGVIARTLRLGGDEAIFLSKTTTFMNLSGKSVQVLMQKHKARLEDLIIVHDDLDIPLGKFRIVKGYGPKLHNGIDSIEQKLGTKDFLRVRIGVDNRTSENRIPGIDYVLQDFTDEEVQIVQNTFPLIANLMKAEKILL